MTPEITSDQKGLGMRKTSLRIAEKASVSLSIFLARKDADLRPNIATKMAGLNVRDTRSILHHDTAAVIFELEAPNSIQQLGDGIAENENFERLDERYWSAELRSETVDRLMRNRFVSRIQGKKTSQPHLTEALPDIGLLSSAGSGQRVIEEDGQGVLIGVIDTGFDLSHPVFRDRQGNLRVDALLDQTAGHQVFDYQHLMRAWTMGPGPGADLNGHGTHVASIAGGSNFNGFEGVAPGARFLLVKTNFRDTDRAVKWIFDRAGAKPCVVNLSLGHHFGSHDGTDVEERLHRALTGPGRLIVVSAGNEQSENLHIGARFFQDETQEVVFDLKRQINDPPHVVLTLWHDEADKFKIDLITPSGQVISLPPVGEADLYQTSILDLEVSCRPYTYSRSIQMQISLSFRRVDVRDRDIENWKVRVTCVKAVIGRLDGWFNNSGYAMFRAHSLVESRRTIGIAATGEGCLAVASHVTRTQWNSDIGLNQDSVLVGGRSSPFSSMGPTRDNRWKPDISAPGQYITAALADNCELSSLDYRAAVASRLLTIEGTSMSAPVITGVVALMLQKNPALDLGTVRKILQDSARHDLHTGPETWHPAYGFGKVDVAAAIGKL